MSPVARLKTAAKQAVSSATQVMETHLPEVSADSWRPPKPVDTPERGSAPRNHFSLAVNSDIRFRDKDWSINVELTNDPSESQWVSISDVP